MKTWRSFQLYPGSESHIRPEETTPGEFHFTKIPEDDVLKLLKGIDGKKAPGLDNISPKLLKIGYAQLCRPLAYIMNLSLASGVVPLAWKKARFLPYSRREITLIPVIIGQYQ